MRGLERHDIPNVMEERKTWSRAFGRDPRGVISAQTAVSEAIDSGLLHSLSREHSIDLREGYLVFI